MTCMAILGASGHGKVVADLAERCGWTHIEFFDDAWPSITQNGSWPVVGTGKQLLESIDKYQGVLVAIGNNKTRSLKLSELKAQKVNIPILVHPHAVVSRHAKLGIGSVVFATAVVNAFATIGDGAIINTGSSVDHDCVLGDCVHVSPGARLAGTVYIGDQSWIGIGAVVKQLIKIGPNVTVGAGAVVLSNVSADLTVVGIPARPLG
ncbi:MULTISPECIES: acetyltransferase [Pseudomonas]|uniref:acetyltransferase n=1 Tax=Pseudomonas TaxID=286 RepID=UPI00048BD067|nr:MULTISPECIES: acetyltransferase [Pseudomonas putida group]